MRPLSRSAYMAGPATSTPTGSTSVLMTPSWMRRMRSLTRATAGSWVTIMTVFPISLFTVERWSTTTRALTVSSSPVGSSARISGGSFVKAAARATLCCSPPLSSPGLCPILSRRPTTSMSSSTRFRRSALAIPRAIMGSSMFSAAVSVGIRFIVWKTWPTVLRRNSTRSAGVRRVTSVSKTFT